MNYNEFMNVIDAYGHAEREFGRHTTNEKRNSVVDAWKKVCEIAVKIDYENFTNTLDK